MSPGLQLVGVSDTIVTTWNPDIGNGTDVEQSSAPFPILLQCPVGYYGQPTEVRLRFALF